MRTVLFLTAGFLLMGGFHLLGRLFAPYFSSAAVALLLLWKLA